MVSLRKIFLIAILPCLLFAALPSYAEDEDSSSEAPPPPPDTPEPMDDGGDDGGGDMGGGSDSSSSTKSAPKSKEKAEVDPALYQDTPVKELTGKELQDQCQKYKGNYVSYYDKVFEITGECKKRELSHQEITTLSKRNVKVKEVESVVIASMPLKVEKKTVTVRSCTSFNNKYVSLETDPGTVYWVEKCKRRLFPDSETVIDHHSKNIFQPPLQITEEEFALIKEGVVMPSVIDKELNERSLVTKSRAEIPTLAEEKVCAGYVGKNVSYLDKIYRIEKSPKGKGCYKSALDGEKFTRQYMNTRPVELSSAEFIAIQSQEIK